MNDLFGKSGTISAGLLWTSGHVNELVVVVCFSDHVK